MKKRLLTSFLLFVFTVLVMTQCYVKPAGELSLPGRYARYTLLPNGWKLTPAGQQIPVGELPLNMVISQDEHYAITTNNGEGTPSLSVIDLHLQKETQRVTVPNAWLGLALNSAGDRLFVSAGNEDAVLVYSFNRGQLKFMYSVALDTVKQSGTVSVAGLTYWPQKNRILAVSKESNTLYAIDPILKQVVDTLAMPGKCYDVLVNHQGNKAYVSVWGEAKIVEVNLFSFGILRTIPAGAHPCEMLITKDDRRLFVADANSNSASVIDLKSGTISETVISSLMAHVPPGSTPNALAFNKDETILFVANADNNDLALFDISDVNHSRSLGFIPVGWYPTVVRYLSKSNRILVANGKGLASQANPLGPKPGMKKKSPIDQYIGRLFKGTVSMIAMPSSQQLSRFSQQVFANTPYISKTKNRKGHQHIVPENHNGQRSSKIRHVFYIIRENRTYDQVLGDVPRGNGDSSLCLFPAAITPNAHALADMFTLYDNFYADAEVSADGHNWSMAAYATDYVEKTWPTLYGGRGGHYDFEGGQPAARPSSGYIWDEVLKKGLTLRNYGEYAWHDKKHPGFYRANDAYMRLYTSTKFPCFDLSIRDTFRFKVWKEEFDQYIRGDSLPDFTLIRLPNDHTAGTRKDFPTVQAMVADNDYALGEIVQTISQSKYWASSMIFILEDDAQNGSDHVDAHRSVLLVAGPYVKHGYVDHTMYSTSSVLKTMELILGLPPMTQYDLSATPLLSSVTDQSDTEPFRFIKPSVDLNEMNSGTAYGAVRCQQMNLSREDAIPDIEFNEIIWKAVKGAASTMPSPVRSAFVMLRNNRDDDDD